MTVAVLSWQAHETLVHTLESYRRFGLDTLGDDDRVIFFQQYTKRDKEIAKEYGYECFGSPDNIGIAEAYKLLLAFASGDLFLFLENDWELIADPVNILQDARELLRNHTVDVIRLRNKHNPGHPLWSRQFQGDELAHPTHLLDSVYWHPNPETFGPIRMLDDWYITTAPYANWTNNPTMFRTEWIRELAPRMSGDIEKDIQPWWQEQGHIRVAQGRGLFTHQRLDR